MAPLRRQNLRKQSSAKILRRRGRSRARCQFTRVHAGTVGLRTAPTGTALPVEKQHRDDCLLDRRETSGNNPVPNRTSSWDKEWTKNYGGMDDPDPAHRSNYIPVNFTPRLNPFYCALPYNDKAREGHRPEAPRVVPWFQRSLSGPGCFHLQRPLGRHPQRQPRRICAMGRCRTVPHRSLAVRFRKRTAKT